MKLFKGYATAKKTHRIGYYKKGEVIPVVKYQHSPTYRMIKEDGSTCLVPACNITNIIERND